MAVPADEKGVWTLSQDSMSYDSTNPTADRTVHVDQYTGKILADVKFADYPFLGKLMAVGIALHEGQLGWWNVALNALFCLSVVSPACPASSCGGSGARQGGSQHRAIRESTGSRWAWRFSPSFSASPSAGRSCHRHLCHHRLPFAEAAEGSGNRQRLKHSPPRINDMRLIKEFAFAAALTLGSLISIGSGHAHEIKVGDIVIGHPWSRQSPMHADVAAGFMLITNEGKEDDRLVKATAEISPKVQLHDMKIDGDVMKMVELPEGIPIPAGGEVELKPKSLHIMFMDSQRLRRKARSSRRH